MVNSNPCIGFHLLGISFSLVKAIKLLSHSFLAKNSLGVLVSKPNLSCRHLYMRNSRALPRSTRRKTSKRTSAILNLRRKYTVFRARSYAANTKEESQPLFANSSRERRRKAPKRSQPSYAVPHINIRR